MKGVSRIDFEENDTLQDSTLYRLGQLGEIAGNLSEDFQQKNPLVPWRQMADMRNRLFHFYDEDFAEVDALIEYLQSLPRVPILVLNPMRL